MSTTAINKTDWVGTKQQYSQLQSIETNRKYYIVDLEYFVITNAAMAEAISLYPTLYNTSDVFLCIDSGTYLQNTFYKFNVSSWTEVGGVVSSSEKNTWNGKQDALVSGTNIKTLNSQSILGSGDLQFATTSQGSKADTALQPADVDATLDSTSTNPIQNKAIAELIPSQATSSNQLVDAAAMNDAINSVTAYYITSNAAGDPFSTKAQLNAASTFYSGGVARTPTRNDYCIVLADESKGTAVSGYSSFTTTQEYVGYFVIYNNAAVEVTSSNKDSVGIVAGTTIAYETLPSTRYTYQGTQWEFQYIFNETPLTTAQLATLNSGLTAADKSKLDGIASGAEVNTLTGVTVNGNSVVTNKVANIETNSAYNASSNKIATMSDIPSVSGFESSSNKVTSVSSTSTDTEYPSAKCVYDLIASVDGIRKVSGTQQEPINLASSLEVGNLYILSGYVTLTSTVVAYSLQYPAMVYKDSTTTLISFNGWFTTSVWTSLDGASGGITINSTTGYITNSNRFLPIQSFNGNTTSSQRPSFYAPTGYGTNGYLLESKGSGNAPTFTIQKVTTISSSSTNNQVPSALAAYNFGQEVSYTTTAPSSANTSGRLKIVVLTSEPATKYDGYIYFITEA